MSLPKGSRHCEVLQGPLRKPAGALTVEIRKPRRVRMRYLRSNRTQDPRRPSADAWERAIGFFAGEKMGRPLHLDNLSRRAIRPAVGDPWHGWHAFRRGLASILFTLGTPSGNRPDDSPPRRSVGDARALHSAKIATRGASGDEKARANC